MNKTTNNNIEVYKRNFPWVLLFIISNSVTANNNSNSKKIHLQKGNINNTIVPIIRTNCINRLFICIRYFIIENNHLAQSFQMKGCSKAPSPER